MMLGLRRTASRLGDVLVEDAVITEAQLRKALDTQKGQGNFLGETLLEMGMVAPDVLGKYLEASTGFPFVELSESDIDLEVARLIPESFARTNNVLPFAKNGSEFSVGMIDPLDLEVADELAAILGGKIVPYLVFNSDLNLAINKTFDVRHRAQSVLEEIPDRSDVFDTAVDALVGLAEDAPIVRLVNSIIQGAIDTKASDIHIEPRDTYVGVRYRMDGLLYDQMQFPIQHLSACVSRIKIMGGMNIAERRRPQDGRFSMRAANSGQIDLRVSIMPTIYGEKVVMRLLDRESSVGTLDNVGLFPEQLSTVRRFIHRPHGIFLVTGPTGSGKSTSLYCGLQELDSSTMNITTVEDPVEFHLAGINQTQVNSKIGVTFAAGLRTLVRQDPDVIMVGEIRDAETAEIAIQAALTGHLVLSTLHTNDAPGAVTRLENMGVEPYLISSAVLGVMGQRLLRTICSSCRTERQATVEQTKMFNLPLVNGEPPMLYYGAGCGKCGQRGLKGRTGCYEIFQMTETMRKLILEGGSGNELTEKARSEGMMTMLESGVQKMLAGITTAEEVLRVLISEDM